jgi:hypothetical protein
MSIFMGEDKSIDPGLAPRQKLGAEITDGAWGYQVTFFGENLFVLGRVPEGIYEKVDPGGGDRFRGKCDDVCATFG